MRNGGAAHKIRSAAEYIMAMPEGLLIASFPLGLSYHRPFDCKGKRFLADARNDDTSVSRVSHLILHC